MTAQLFGVSINLLSELIYLKSLLSAGITLRICISNGTLAESWMIIKQKLPLCVVEQKAPAIVVPLSLNCVD